MKINTYNNHNLPELIPREILFNTPIINSHYIKVPQLSPDGKKILYFLSINNMMGIWIKTIGKEDERLIISDEKMTIVDYRWITDKYIIYFQDKNKTQNTVIYRFNLETGEIKQLTPEKNVRARHVYDNECFPYNVIISMNKDNPALNDLYCINILTEDINLIYRNPGNVVSWLINNNFQLQGMVLSNNDGTSDVIMRENEKSEWKKLLTWDLEDKPLSRVIDFSKDNSSIYLTDSRNANTCRIIKMEIATGNIEVIAEDPEYDIIVRKINDIFMNPVTSEIQAVPIIKYRKEWLFLDETIKEDFEIIEKLDYGDLSILDINPANEVWLVSFDKDNGMTSYYGFDRKSKKGTFLFCNQSPLNDYTMAAMEEITFTSGDGLTIHGYITYPPGLDRSNLPLVLYVHEGPWWRDFWGYNPIVQWFANRGYACLQINYRGSIGYGKDFLKAGYKEWGGKMQDDLTDAVNWAVKEKIADPDKIAIYGFAYGGYAALVGATSTPELFRCAVSINSPSNLITLIQSVPSYMKAYCNRFIKRIGDPETEKEFLISRSPLFKSENIKIPVLISHGFNNQIIKTTESYQMVKTIRSMGIDAEYVVLQDEGKNLSAKNFIKLHMIIERFLSKHLGGRYEEREIQEKEIYIANSPDKKLIDKILRENDENAFQKLEERYKKPVIKHIFNMTGDFYLSMELAQEAFFNLWIYLDTYNFSMPFSTWLFSIATNLVKKYWSMNYNMDNRISIDEIDNYVSIQGWEKDIEDKLLFQSILTNLREPYKTVVNLRFMENMDYKTIASIMNTNENQIKNYLFRAKNLLINYLEKNNQ